MGILLYRPTVRVHICRLGNSPKRFPPGRAAIGISVIAVIDQKYAQNNTHMITVK